MKETVSRIKKLEVTAIYYQVPIIPRIRRVVYGEGGAELVGNS
jgi:hypothetical protein